MRADLHGPDHSATLDAARRAQNVGQERENDNEEEEEEEELGLLQAHLATRIEIPAAKYLREDFAGWSTPNTNSKHKFQRDVLSDTNAQQSEKIPSMSRHISNATKGTSVIRSVKLCLPVAANLSACLPACLCLPRGDMSPKYSQTPPTPSCKYSNAC